MKTSRGMGAISPTKMPKGKTVVRKDKPQKVEMLKAGGSPGLYANINAKRKRIEGGSGEKMRKVGSKGSPTADAFVQSLKTAKK